MRFKLDENIGTRAREAFAQAGHEAFTVREQGLAGCSDQRLFAACRKEGVCLVTLDLGFSDVTRFPPGESSRIVVIRVPRPPTLRLLTQLISQFLAALKEGPIARELWIVEPGRIRIHQSKQDK